MTRNIEDSKLEKIIKKLSNRFEKVQVFSKLILTFSAIPIISGGMLTFCNSIGKNGTTDPLSSGLIGSGIVIFVEVALAARVIYQEYKLQKNSNEKWWENEKKQSV